MSGSRYLACNLCWQELKPPFIVTACKHAFCKEHENDPRFKAGTCPGCSAHLPEKGGVRFSMYEVEKSQEAALAGITPEQAFKMAYISVEFWLKQERHKNDFAKHELEKEKRRFDELKSEAMQLVDQKERALLAERAEKEQARGANEELSREVSVLQHKWPAAIETRDVPGRRRSHSRPTPRSQVPRGGEEGPRAPGSGDRAQGPAQAHQRAGEPHP